MASADTGHPPAAPMNEPLRGFILTPTYRIARGRPEVHLYGRLENGDPTLVIDDRYRPSFYVPASRANEIAPMAPGASVRETRLRTAAGTAVAEVTVGVPAEVPPLRHRLEAAAIPCFEADIPFASRYLFERGLRGAFAVRGAWTHDAGLGRVYRNPEIEPAHWTPALRVLSIDLETSPRAERIYSIACHGPGVATVLMVTEHAVTGVETVPTERALLERFLGLLREWDPDVLTGWNVVDFDLAVLERQCRRHGICCALGRTDEELEIRKDASFTRESRAIVCGRVVLDGLSAMRGAFIKLDDYRLETAAQAFLGKGKLFTGDRRWEEVEAAYRDAPHLLAEYNLNDARLVSELLAHTQLIELAINRSLLTGMPLDRVSAAIASVDSLYVPEMHRRGVVAPSVRKDVAAARVTGGYVMESRPGLYRNILVFDFKSLYPSIIRTFNLDPLTHAQTPPPGTADVVRAPNGACFRKQPRGILPELVARLAAEREGAKRAGNAVASHAIKILMNSLYGVLGSGASRLFSPDVANAITHFGQDLIQRAADLARNRGHAVIYGDTDSLFVDPGEPDPELARQIGERLCRAITAELAAQIQREFGCESHLELQFETLYRRFFLPEVRGGSVGSKKRYAGLVADGGREHIEFVGLESVRRDWTEASKRFQHDLLDRVFHDQPIDEFVRDFVRGLRDGACDALLTYRKAIRKPLDAYTKTTPPHVRAARRSGRVGRLVEYVMTTAGPHAVGDVSAPIDHEHYVEHQIKPVADAILRFLGRDFDEITGARRQLNLF